MLNNMTNFLNLIRDGKIKTAETIAATDLIPLGTKDANYGGGYQPTLITYEEFVNSLPAGGVQSVTGLNTDNTDPANPVVQLATDLMTVLGDGTVGNPLTANINYANVIWVDSINGNDLNGAVNDFTKPFSTINAALVSAASLFPSSSQKGLIYIRRGYHVVSNQVSTTVLVDYVDFYSEPGVVITGGYGRISDQYSTGPVNVNFMGYADLYNCDFYIVKESTVNIEANNVTTGSAALLVIPASNTANVTYTANTLTTDALGTAYGITVRNSSNVVINIKKEYRSSHSNLYTRFHSGKIVFNCPNIVLTAPSYYGGNWKSCVKTELGLGGTIVINGNLVNEDTGGYYGGQSGMISRLANDSNERVTLNGNIYAGDTFGVYGLGVGSEAKTIINGSVISNHLVAYVSNTCVCVFRNGTLVNNNTQAAAATYPVLSAGGSGVVWVENCHLYSGGTGSGLVSAFWKDTTTATLNVYNSVYSAADTSGFFIRNSAGGQPVNNVRILNCRATKALDTNITDILSPTGFTQDANITALNFI